MNHWMENAGELGKLGVAQSPVSSVNRLPYIFGSFTQERSRILTLLMLPSLLSSSMIMKFCKALCLSLLAPIAFAFARPEAAFPIPSVESLQRRDHQHGGPNGSGHNRHVVTYVPQRTIQTMFPTTSSMVSRKQIKGAPCTSRRGRRT